MPVVFSIAPQPGMLCSSILIRFIKGSLTAELELTLQNTLTYAILVFSAAKNQHNRAAANFCLPNPYIIDQYKLTSHFDYKKNVKTKNICTPAHFMQLCDLSDFTTVIAFVADLLGFSHTAVSRMGYNIC